jgi:hypothetical protein
MLKNNKRPADAFHVFRMALHHNATFEPSLLMDTLQSFLDCVESPVKPAYIYNNKYEIHLLFEELQRGFAREDPRVDLERLARLEWAYLELLDGHIASPVTLHGLLRDKPDFFVEVLGLIFRPKGESSPEAKTPSEQEKQRAQSAYRLLMTWREIPGQQKDRTVDERALFAWLKKARSPAEERGLLEVCDLRIGEVFAHDPELADTPWPSIPVRDALEDIGTDEVFRGFGSGIYNKRGVVSKSMREGGAQEWALAAKYKRFAEACYIDWPKTAAALRRMAEGYEEHARREDTEAMLD